MIKLKNGGVVRVVETQREADFYEKTGYIVISSDEEETAPEGADNGADDGANQKPEGTGEDDDKKTGVSGKKGTPKEE